MCTLVFPNAQVSDCGASGNSRPTTRLLCVLRHEHNGAKTVRFAQARHVTVNDVDSHESTTMGVASPFFRRFKAHCVFLFIAFLCRDVSSFPCSLVGARFGPLGVAEIVQCAIVCCFILS